MTVFLLVLIALLGYVLGSISETRILTMYIFGKFVRKANVRLVGLPEFYRVFHIKGAILFVLYNLVRAAIVVLLSGLLLKSRDAVLVGRLFGAFCLMLGYMFPLFYSFAGNLGILSAGIALLLVDWRLGLCAIVVFAVILVLTQYLSVAYTFTALLTILASLLFKYDSTQVLLLLFTAIVIIVRCIPNLGRLMNGMEPKAELPGFLGKLSIGGGREKIREPYSENPDYHDDYNDSGDSDYDYDSDVSSGRFSLRNSMDSAYDNEYGYDD